MSGITKNPARQEMVVAHVDVSYSDLTSGADFNAIRVPQNAIVLGGAIIPLTAFNSATSDVLDVGDSGSENRYKNDANIAATSLVALVPTGYKYAAADWITVRWVGVSTAPSAGQFRLVVYYMQVGKSEFTQD